jgi:hypothetical protein
MVVAPQVPQTAVPPVGSFVQLRYGSSDVRGTIVEHRGPIGRGGRHLFRVRFVLESTDEPVETEVPLEELTVIAHPQDPAERRVGAEGFGDQWIGTYTAPDGRVAVVTTPVASRDKAIGMAKRWLAAGAAEDGQPPGKRPVYHWSPDAKHPGRYAVFRQSRLGDELVRESG